MIEDQNVNTLRKVPTGIDGFDEITCGGLPKGRTTLVCGSAGSGKTLFSMEFLVKGAVQFNEPGVFVCFEETPEKLIQNFTSLGYDLKSLSEQKLISFIHIPVKPHELREAGEYDLEGLFARIGHTIDSIGAKRIVIDTIDALFLGLPDTSALQQEIRRLFGLYAALESKEVTAIITGERITGAGWDTKLTRWGFEEYVSDCVVSLKQIIADRLMTRTIWIVKYRGTPHGSDEYPFLIDEKGLSILPITSIKLEYEASYERVSTGIKRLDTMLEGKGYIRGSSILVSGTSGSGKTCVASAFIYAAFRRSERCLFMAFEESPELIIRNMSSVSIDLKTPLKQGLLKFHTARPTLYGPEMHLVTIYKLVREFKPSIVVFDPISSFIDLGNKKEFKSMFIRLIDFLKMKKITVLFTDLIHDAGNFVQSSVAVSSLMDTWILLQNVETNGERNRLITILKCRGSSHSNQVREFILTNQGIELKDAYIGHEKVLTGAARLTQEARDKAQKTLREQEIKDIERQLENKRKAFKAKIAAMNTDFEAEVMELEKKIQEIKLTEEVVRQDRMEIAKHRRADIIRKK